MVCVTRPINCEPSSGVFLPRLYSVLPVTCQGASGSKMQTSAGEPTRSEPASSPNTFAGPDVRRSTTTGKLRRPVRSRSSSRGNAVSIAEKPNAAVAERPRFVGTRMWSMIGGDGLDESFRQGFDQCFAIVFRSKRGIHLAAGMCRRQRQFRIAFQEPIGQAQMVWRDLGGDDMTAIARGAQEGNRLGATRMRDVKPASNLLQQRDVSRNQGGFAGAGPRRELQTCGRLSRVGDPSQHNGRVLLVHADRLVERLAPAQCLFHDACIPHRFAVIRKSHRPGLGEGAEIRQLFAV